MINKDFLRRYINSNSPTGFEEEGQRMWIDYVRPFVDKIETDAMSNVVGVINPDAKFKVAVVAHADEVSWAVRYITKEGYIYLDRNGGSDYEVAPASRVVVHLDNGEKINGVFGWPAIHVRPRDSKTVPNQKNIILDIGCDSDEEVRKMGVHVGTIVTQEGTFAEMNGGRYYVGRAFDNRMGGVMVAEVARKIFENKDKLPFGVYFCNCVQEEVGLYGSKIVSHWIKPNLAIVVDACHDTHSPLYDKIENGDIACGAGPVVTFSPIVNKNLRKHILSVAEKKNIKVQYDFSGRSTGTDTDSFAHCQEGIPSALISWPVKYMHTTCEVSHSDDVENGVELIYQSLKVLDPNFEVKSL